MNILVFGYVALAWSLGSLCGVLFELVLDYSQMKKLEDKVRDLKRENHRLKREAKVERIEIVDHRAEPESYFTPF